MEVNDMVYGLTFAEIMSLGFAFMGIGQIVDKLCPCEHDNDIIIGLVDIVIAVLIWYFLT